jgi:hypothetical protein
MDHIAAVVDNFFLMSYAFVNIVCAMLSLLHSPNWDPDFAFYHWSVSALSCRP